MDKNETEVLNSIFTKMAKDPEFRNKLFNEPLEVLAKFEISEKAKNLIADTINNILNQ